jgi:HlyD family secretion protein
MRRWIVRISVLTVLIAAVILLRATYFAPQPVEVDVVAAERGTVEATVTNTKAGTVMARRRASLSTEVGGRVVALPYREGDSVRRGDVLVELDDSNYRARLQLAQRDHEAAEARRDQTCLAAEQASRELQRNRTLADRRIISQNLLDQLENTAQTTAAACKAAEVGVSSAVSSIDVLNTELAKTVLRAPFDGVIAQLNTEVGEWITPSPPAMPIPAVIDLIDPSSIYISAPMDEVDSARIDTGQKVRVTIDPYPDRTFPGRVVRVAPYVVDIEAQNRTVEIEVELDDDQFAAGLLPGTSADVEVILEVRDNVLRVPTATLMEGSSVMVIENGVLTVRQVQTGLRNWDFVEITEGLSPGDQVVTSLDRAEVQPGAEAVVAGDTASGP